MSIKVYNTRTRRKETFEPVNDGMTGFYVCGPTVYDYFHIGNARPFIVFDAIRRYLIYRGYSVKYVMNLTDIDDKIIQRANREGVETRRIAQRYIQAFFEDIRQLGVWPADVYPRATDHIPDILALIRALVDKGIAYESGGDVYYDVSKFANYAALSGKKIDDLQAGARIAVDARKKNPLDFVLWKASKPGEPAWPSPWGQGRPGWHIECSAMAMKYLGESFDIHAGGQDLIFPHHENEKAQSEAATGKEFARYWLHNGFLDIRGEKMAKSTGNFITAREVLKRYPPTALRLFFLQKHYRSPIDFSGETLQSAVVSNTRISATWRKISEAAGTAPPYAAEEPARLDSRQQPFFAALQALHTELLAAMDDDFNTSLASGKFFDLLRETNRFIDGGVRNEVDRQLVALALQQLEGYDGFFGIIDREGGRADRESMDNVLKILLDMRQRFRREKDFAAADRIRDELAAAGLVIEDTPAGPKWHWKDHSGE